MTDEIQVLHHTVLSVIKSVTIKSSLTVGIATCAALIYLMIKNVGDSWWFMPASILFGGGIGLLNFRWLALAVERKLSKRITPKGSANTATMIINGLKLAAIFIVLFVVIKWQMVHVFGLVIGLSLCFLAVIWEGLTLIKDS
jgi:F0F1-type ATP synthase assembly protein I